mgnify:CR=1 FL=1|jgi:hypothetical protein
MSTPFSIIKTYHTYKEDMSLWIDFILSKKGNQQMSMNIGIIKHKVPLSLYSTTYLLLEVCILINHSNYNSVHSRALIIQLSLLAE